MLILNIILLLWDNIDIIIFNKDDSALEWELKKEGSYQEGIIILDS